MQQCESAVCIQTSSPSWASLLLPHATPLGHHRARSWAPSAIYTAASHLAGVCFLSVSGDSAAEPRLKMYLDVSRKASSHSGNFSLAEETQTWLWPDIQGCAGGTYTQPRTQSLVHTASYTQPRAQSLVHTASYTQPCGMGSYTHGAGGTSRGTDVSAGCWLGVVGREGCGPLRYSKSCVYCMFWNQDSEKLRGFVQPECRAQALEGEMGGGECIRTRWGRSYNGAELVVASCLSTFYTVAGCSREEKHFWGL